MSTKHDEEKLEELDLTQTRTIDLEQEKKLASSADDALAFAVESGRITWTPEEERKLLWKIDLRLLPLMLIASLLAYTDAQAYGMAAIFGLIQDLKLFVATISDGKIVLDLTKYQWSNSITNCGSMFGEYPILILAQFLPLGKFTSGVMMYSGLLALLVITCSDFADIMALRFFYGFQAVTTPLFVIISTMWWKTSEQPLRIGIWASGASFGSIVGQGIDFGAIKIGGEYADHRWKWIYVIIGSISMGFALVMFLFMPDSPMKALFLTEREKAIAVQRLQGNNTGIQTRKFKWRQFVEAFLDPQLYTFCVIGFSFAFANAALGSFGGLLVTSFGYSNQDALKLSMPASGIAIFSMLFSGALSFKFHRHRCLMACLFILSTIAGNALLWKSPRDNKSALLAGLYIVSFPSSSFPSLTSRTISFLYPSSFHQPFTPTLTSNPKSQQPSTAPTSSCSPSFPPT